MGRLMKVLTAFSNLERAIRSSTRATGEVRGSPYKRSKRTPPPPIEVQLFAARGGKRRGAGRPPKGRHSSERHQRRPALRADQPVHVVLRCAAAVGRLRKRDIYHAIRWASIAMAARHLACRVIHASIQGNHLHLIVEADDRMKLARGMQAFQISAAQRINRAISKRTGTRRRGQVFTDRYHATILTSPRQVRHALAYVLNNWRRHGEDQRGLARTWTMDPFSSGVYFDGWKERAGERFIPPLRETYQPLFVWFARSWLLTTGWRRHGLVSVAEVPR